MHDQKTRLRRKFRQFRTELDSSTRGRHDLARLVHLQKLPEILAANRLFSYISTGTEADTHRLLDWLLGQGKQLAVPNITGNGLMIAVPFTGWSGLQTGPLGIPIPTVSDSFSGQIEVCITPGLAFTAMGDRLGQGLGYYDRWFADHPVRYRIALAYECQLTNEIPTDARDVRMDIIVTEQRVIRVS
jgi:5-formyltetrahydrofolate cyclo-ligase